MSSDSYPSVDLALVSAHFCGDVVLENRGERCSAADRRDPGWELRVPAYRTVSIITSIFLLETYTECVLE